MHIINHNLKKDRFIYWENAVADAVEQLFNYSDSNQPIFEKNKINTFYFLDGDNTSFQFSRSNLDNLKNILDLYINSKIYLKQDRNEQTDLLHKKFIFLLSAFAIAVAKDIAMDDSDFEYFKVDLINTLIKKQNDYGPTNISKFGITGLAIRMYDKIGRLTNLTASGNKPMVENEPLLDTALDLVGYCSIAIMWLEDNFLLPMRIKDSQGSV
jgi:hypothetical protein